MRFRGRNDHRVCWQSSLASVALLYTSQSVIVCCVCVVVVLLDVAFCDVFDTFCTHLCRRYS